MRLTLKQAWTDATCAAASSAAAVATIVSATAAAEGGLCSTLPLQLHTVLLLLVWSIL
jgi:hypothetical protein